MLKIILFIIGVVFLTLGVFLDITTDPKKSDIIVCIGGSELSKITTSIELANKELSKYDKIIYMGMREQLKWHLNKNISIKQEVLNEEKIVFTRKFTNTLDELKFLEIYLKINNYNNMILVAEPTHAKRIDMLIENFTNIKYSYTIVSSNPTWWNKYFYFLNSRAILISFVEINKIFYNYIKYNSFLNSEIIIKIDKFNYSVKSYLYKKYNF